MLIGPSGGAKSIWETHVYDADGRQTRRIRRTSSVVLFDESFWFDAHGRPVKVGRATAANGAPTDTSHFVYAGLGAVEARDRIDLFGNWESEEYRADALGNNLESRDGQSKYVAGYCSFAPGMRSLSSSQPIGITFESSGLMRSAFQQTLLSR